MSLINECTEFPPPERFFRIWEWNFASCKVGRFSIANVAWHAGLPALVLQSWFTWNTAGIIFLDGVQFGTEKSRNKKGMIANPFGVIVLQSKTYVVEWIESLGQQVFNYTHHGVDLKNMVVSGMSLFKKHFNFETSFLSIPGWLYAIFAAQPFDSALVSSLSHSRPLAATCCRDCHPEAIHRVTAPPGREEIRRSGSGTQSTRSLGNCWSKKTLKISHFSRWKGSIWRGGVIFSYFFNWKLWNCETSVWRWSRFQLKSWSMLIHIDSSPRARKASKKLEPLMRLPSLCVGIGIVVGTGRVISGCTCRWNAAQDVSWICSPYFLPRFFPEIHALHLKDMNACVWFDCDW